ncbi:AMP-activated serine/threonine-protein kinase regulatory subunit [Phlyctochytrium planicorne]|nr:AMP-activated serine/threonine-protein kinase regulatory subunit [Phlyctochytrium planicorne]
MFAPPQPDDPSSALTPGALSDAESDATSSTTARVETVLVKLGNYLCYDLLPLSSKLIVMDKTLLVKKALNALAQHGVQSAPLWEASTQTFAGMLTVTDFINLLIHYNNTMSYEAAVENFNNLTIQGLRDIGHKAGFVTPIRHIHPMRPIAEACKVLLDNHIHRIALVDRGENGCESIVSVISQFKILRFIAKNLGRVNEGTMTVEELGIGTKLDKIATASPQTLLVEILNLFVTKHVSAVPIVDSEGVLLDVYERYDVLSLSRDLGFCDVKIPVGEALSKRSQDFEGIHTCTMEDTLGDLLEAIQHMTVHRFIIIDDGRKLVGIISLSDILRLLANKYRGDEST